MSVQLSICLRAPLQPHALELSGSDTQIAEHWFFLYLQAKP